MTESPQFIGLLGQREIVLIRKILRENNATEEEMKKLFEEERMRKRLTAALQEVRAEILVQHGETWIACDSNQHFRQLSPAYDLEKILRWFALSGNRRLDMVLLLRSGFVLPMGIFENNTYRVL